MVDNNKYLWPLLLALILIALQLWRIIAFIDVYGGVEHDGGWIISIARSLAEQGTYTTMVSTIPNPDLAGAESVDLKFDIQAEDGRIWFFTGNGIGPSSILPDALVLWLFGTGFWALRAGPLKFYGLMLLGASYILYRLAGVWAIVLFHAFLYFYPHISIFLSYEAMGEVPSMAYILAAYIAFVGALYGQKRRWLALLGTGAVVALAISAKLIALWSVSGIFMIAGLLWLSTLFGLWRQSDWPRLHFGEVFALGGGVALTLSAWELVRLVVLTRLAGFDMYVQHAYQRWVFIRDDGSGIGERLHSGASFFWDKFFLLSEIAHPERAVTALVFAAILIGGPLLFWLWQGQQRKQIFIALLWLGWLVNTIWFVGMGKTGWPRHFWFGLVLAIVLLSTLTVALLRPPSDRVRPMVQRGAGVALLGLLVWGFWSQPHVRPFFIGEALVEHWREKQVANIYDASLPWIIIPRAAQQEVINYIQAMPPGARVYYPAGHKSAEIPPQSGRLHYPLHRRQFVEAHPEDVLLISPSLISPWNKPTRRQDLLELVERACPLPALRNDYYMLCPIDANLAQTGGNPLYSP